MYIRDASIWMPDGIFHSLLLLIWYLFHVLFLSTTYLLAVSAWIQSQSTPRTASPRMQCVSLKSNFSNNSLEITNTATVLRAALALSSPNEFSLLSSHPRRHPPGTFLQEKHHHVRHWSFQRYYTYLAEQLINALIVLNGSFPRESNVHESLIRIKIQRWLCRLNQQQATVTRILFRSSSVTWSNLKFQGRPLAYTCFPTQNFL